MTWAVTFTYLCSQTADNATQLPNNYLNWRLSHVLKMALPESGITIPRRLDLLHSTRDFLIGCILR